MRSFEFRWGHTPLDDAMWNGSEKLINLIREHGGSEGKPRPQQQQDEDDS